MSRKQKKKDAREQSTRQLMGIDDITDYGIATRMGELVFFAIKPTNISVLPDAGVGARIYALLNVVKGMAEIEMLALNSKESFENNKAFYRQRADEEELPVIRKLLDQDSTHLDRIWRCWPQATGGVERDQAESCQIGSFQPGSFCAEITRFKVSLRMVPWI